MYRVSNGLIINFMLCMLPEVQKGDVYADYVYPLAYQSFCNILLSRYWVYNWSFSFVAVYSSTLTTFTVCEYVHETIGRPVVEHPMSCICIGA